MSEKADENIFEAQELMGRGHDQLKQKKFDEAVKSFAEAHKLLPDGYLSKECVLYSLYAKFRISVASGQKSNIEESFQKLGRWAVEYKDMKESHLLLGHAYRAVGNSTEALNCYKNALKLDPAFEDAQRALDTTARESGVVHKDPVKEAESFSRRQKITYAVIAGLFLISGIINYQFWFGGPSVDELDPSIVSHILPAEKLLSGGESITVQVKEDYSPKLGEAPEGAQNMDQTFLVQQAWDEQCQKVLNFFEPDGVKLVVLSDSQRGLHALCMGAMAMNQNR